MTEAEADELCDDLLGVLMTLSQRRRLVPCLLCGGLADPDVACARCAVIRMHLTELKHRGERWLPIPGHDDRYQVSDHGRVRRTPDAAGWAPLLKPGRTSRGYLKVCLGRRHQHYVHRLVMLAFAGPCPPGYQVDHIDFDREHNARENLRYLRTVDNRWRWAVNEIDPAELPRYDAMAAEADLSAWGVPA